MSERFKILIIENNGEKREFPFTGSQLQLALVDEQITQALEGKVIKKIVNVPGRIVNFVVEEV